MTIDEVKEKTVPVFDKYGIEYAGVFGSVARGQDTPASDVDIITRFGEPMGMFRYMSLIRGLEESLHKKVDLVTERSLNKYVRPFVMPEIKTIYEKGYGTSE